MTPKPGPSLLSLPPELRDQILLHTLHQTWNAESTLRIIPNPDIKDGQIYFWPEDAKWNPAPLLAICKQLRHEIQGLMLSQHKASTVRFEIDLRVKGWVYTPTWTYMSFALRPRDRIDELKVCMTIYSTEAFRRNDSWPRQPGQVFGNLLRLLNRFLFRGPSFLDRDPPAETPGPHFIKRLSVHVGFEDWYTPATWAETVYEIFSLMKALSLLDTAHQYIGSIHVTTMYSYRGEEISRDREWRVVPVDQAIFKEADWARSGFHFGQHWLQKHPTKLAK
ncbi:Hypothetical predicted protein [Lecanosticta acicola]|uniref:Uncharacterized protein n=1 Tax=Lecanosticta acicola TaxID=111012 RepID=A0AAI9E887_9PEZI|nr:Hypothetical predicted protein [Lecanosticta acicola]